MIFEQDYGFFIVFALTYFCDQHLMSGEKFHVAPLHKEWNPDREIPFAVILLNTRAAEH